MTAAARNPVTSKKRKKTGDQPAHTKKKSSLFNQPQNFYAPPSIASMTKDELSEWRKEQRRKRNRESAAASRNKTRAKIEELEGEVSRWKNMYRDMEVRMRSMEQHIQILTQLNGAPRDDQPQRTAVAPLQQTPPPVVVSHPNSPPVSPTPRAQVLVPHAVTSFVPPLPALSPDHATHLFPPLLSEPQDCMLVETQKAESVAAEAIEESRKHLKPISRQA